jgi:heptaprenyl diphosphate synthase
MTPGIDPRSVPHLERDLDRVRDVLGLTYIPDRADLAPLTSGQEGSGRLVRPTLVLLSYYVLTDPAEPANDRAIRAAAAVELIHMGSLYHNDVVDRAPLRRGKPSANALWGTQLAVPAGSPTVAPQKALRRGG